VAGVAGLNGCVGMPVSVLSVAVVRSYFRIVLFRS